MKEATENKGAAAALSGEELVEFVYPRNGPDDRKIFAGVNGESIQLMTGERVMIKRKFAEVLRNKLRQEEAAYAAMKQAEEQSRVPLANL